MNVLPANTSVAVRHDTAAFGQVLRATWWSAAGVIWLLCLVLLTRRMAGELRQPLGGATLVALGLLASLVAAFLRIARPGPPQAGARWTDFVERLVMPGCCVLMFGAAIALPASPPLARGLFWVTLVSCEGGWWYAALGGKIGRGRWLPFRWRKATPSRRHPIPSAFFELDPDRTTVVELSDDADDVCDNSLPDEVSQQLTRMHTAAAGETLLGLVRAGFAASERSQIVHIAFCPPFEGTPLFHAEQIAGPPVTIKAAQVESYGVRLELKLGAKSDCAESVVIRFEAVWHPPIDAGPQSVSE